MASKTFQIIAIIAAVVIVGTVTLAVVATGSDDGGQEGGFFKHLHGLGQYLHGGGDHHDRMAQVIEQLELTPDQLQRFEKIHAIVANVGGGGDGAMVELHDSLVTQFEQGYVRTDEIRRIIDGQLEQIRSMAYAVTDELIALVNELDETQREVLLKHLEGTKAGGHGHGHGHGH